MNDCFPAHDSARDKKGRTVMKRITIDFAKEHMMRLLRNSVFGALVLAAIAVALASKTVLADDDGAPIKGTFAVSAMFPSALNYCPSSGTPIEAQGIGNISRLGPLFLT